MALSVLEPGTIVGGHYRVDAVIGRGTYGIVYRATDPAGGAIALKVLGFDPDVYTDGAEVFDARVEREIKALRRLNSSSVVRLHDWGMHGDAFYLAMEFVEGRTLAQVIAEAGRMEPARVVSLGQAVLAGLADAHQVGIVHRDLKPENIMVVERATGGEEIRILDFGVARLQAQSGNTYETKEGDRIFGTPAYMAPEQGLGQVVAQSDLYAVATIMFEMLVGRLPFDDPQPLQIMIAKLQQPIPTLLEDFGTPPDLVAVVHRALQRRPGDRYFDALSMYRALSNARLDVVHPQVLMFGDQTPDSSETNDEPMQLAPTVAQKVLGGPVSGSAASAPSTRPWLEALRVRTYRTLATPRARRMTAAAAVLMIAAGLLFAGGPPPQASATPSIVPDGTHGGLIRHPRPTLRAVRANSSSGVAIAQQAKGRK